MSRKNGFTLIEIIIVIILIGILVAAIGPRLLQQQNSFKVEAAAEQIANHIRLAQSHTIAQHVNFTIGFDIANEKYSVYRTSNSQLIKNPLKPGQDLIVDFTDSSDQLYGVLIHDADFPNDSGYYSVEFTPLGKPQHSSAGKVVIKKGDETRNIGVAAETGAVSIW